MSSGKYRKEHNCLNCGSNVETHYCSNCGQPNLELKESFWAFVSHSIAHYFHFDNKFFQTLVPLLSKPGKVTLDYLAGKRARYINPISMYIFVSIVYFLVVYSPKHIEKNQAEPFKFKKEKSEKIGDTVRVALQEAGIKDNFITKAATKSLNRTGSMDDFKHLTFAEQGVLLQNLKKENLTLKSDSLTEVIKDFNSVYISRNDSTYNSYLARQKKLPLLKQDNWFQRMIKKRAITLGEKTEVIQQTLEHNRPKQYFLLMPLLALFIMWNFRKNHIYYLNHLIFTIHGMTAYFIVSVFTQPIIKYVLGENSFLSTLIKIGVVVWICWYMFNALKIFYQRKKVIGKMFMIFILYYAALKITEVIMINLIYYIAI